jgi:hypothetical protein
MNGRKMGWLARPVAVVSLLGLATVTLLAPGQVGLKEARAEEKAGKEKLRVGPGFSQAMLATQLALQGEKRKSPILLLAAAELVRDLKESERSTKEVKFEGAGADDKSPLTLTVAGLADKAKSYAKKDKDLSALVQKRAEQLTSRGIDPSVGEKLDTVRYKDLAFKILGGGRIRLASSATVKNVPFEANKLAMVGAIGENSSANLVVEVRDENGKKIENPPSVDSRSIIVWFPNRAESVTVTIYNNGNDQKVVLLANWN